MDPKNETETDPLAGNPPADGGATADALAHRAFESADAIAAPTDGGQGAGLGGGPATPNSARLDSAAGEKLGEVALDLLGAALANVVGMYLGQAIPQDKADELGQRLRATAEEKSAIKAGCGHLVPCSPITPGTAGITQLLLGVTAWGGRGVAVMVQAKELAKAANEGAA
jgi:hypothetical protein